MKLTRFAKFSWAVVVWNLAVILWGAYVRASGSGAGCGSHWPLCNGEIIPQASQLHTLIEFTHRILSGAAMLMVLTLLVWAWQIYPACHRIRLGAALSATFIIVEAFLGAGLVLFKLTADNDSVARAIAMAVHLANTFILIACLALTAAWASGLPTLRLKGQKALPWLVLGMLGIILIGMSGAVTALGDTLFPVDSLRAGLEADADPSAHFLIQLRVYHPIIAALVAMYSMYLIRHLLGKASDLQRRLLFILIGTFGLQLVAGTINLLLLAPIPMQIIHLLLADLTWIAYVLTTASILVASPTE